jgi:sulfur-oxidizing protein SoxY
LKGNIKMKRREFITFGATALVAMPMVLSAKDMLKEKPDAWKATTPADSIKALFGDAKPEEKGVNIKAPKLAENGGKIPVFVKSDIEAKTVALFQDSNPRSIVAVWNVPEGGVVDYGVTLKMKKTGKLTAVVEGKDGKLYMKVLPIEVSKGGCGG